MGRIGLYFKLCSCLEPQILLYFLSVPLFLGDYEIFIECNILEILNFGFFGLVAEWPVCENYRNPDLTSQFL